MRRTTRWYVVRCKDRQEPVAEAHLRRQRFQVYLPRLLTRQRASGSWRDVVEALFPGYLFVGADPVRQSLRPVHSTRGVLGLVRFGDCVAQVPTPVITELRQREDSHRLHLDPSRAFAAGDAVEVVEGSFSGLKAVFAEHEGKRRAVLLLEALGLAHRVSLPLDFIVKAA